MTKTVLLVDDNPHILKHLRLALETQQEFTVCGVATDGQQAIQLARALLPDLIILDFSLPGLNGLDVAAAIHQCLPRVPIMLFTVHRTRFLDAQALATGVRAVISKTEGLEPLLSRAKDFLGLDNDTSTTCKL